VRRLVVPVLCGLVLVACGTRAKDAGPFPTVDPVTVATIPRPGVTLGPPYVDSTATTTSTTTTPAVPTASTGSTLPVPTTPPRPPAVAPTIAPPVLNVAPNPAKQAQPDTTAPPVDRTAVVWTPIGCADGTDPAALDRFLADRHGPLMGFDYPHVQPLPDGRSLWLVQDAFVDHGGKATTLAGSRLIRNAALVQEGRCFSLLDRGPLTTPSAFERGSGDVAGKRWWWPLGSEVRNDRVWVFWAEMQGDASFPRGGYGLPWQPVRTWLASYSTSDLTRLSWAPAPDQAVNPIYGYAVTSDPAYSYLFGNTYQQDLQREGGWLVPHSATQMFVARVPRGRLDLAPEYWSGASWTRDRAAAVPIVSRFQIENPMQPRFVDGRWLAVTKAEGFYGTEIVVDVAPAAQGPWQEAARVRAPRRREDPRVTSYHAYPLPWRGAGGTLAILVSQNALDALDAPAPEAWMYRPLVMTLSWPPDWTPPPPSTTTTLPPDTTAPATTVETTTTTVVTTVPTTTTSTTVEPSTTSSTSAPTSTTTTSTTVDSTTSTVAG
jgi:hypothetical protein